MSRFSTAVSLRAQRSEQPKACKLGVHRYNMLDEDREALDLAITKVRAGSQGFSIAWLVDILNENNFPVGKTVVSDHLAGRCACERSE